MSATYATATHTYSTSTNPRPRLSFIPVLVLVTLGFPVIFGTHAVIEHGNQAHAIRKCLTQNGPALVFKQGDVKYLICHLPDGRYGIQAVRKGAYDLYHELTAFIKGKGTLTEVESYMARLGADFGVFP